MMSPLLLIPLLVLLFASTGSCVKVCGNFCGPDWCAGQNQAEGTCVANGSWEAGMPVSGNNNCIDTCCKTHDKSCAAGGQERVDANRLLAACATGCILNPLDFKLECAETIAVTMGAIKDQCCGAACPVTTATQQTTKPAATTATPTTKPAATTATPTTKPAATTATPMLSTQTKTNPAATTPSPTNSDVPQECQSNTDLPKKGGNLCRLCCSPLASANTASLKRFRVRLALDYDSFQCDSWEALMRGRYNAPSLNVCTLKRGSVETWVELPAARASDVNATMDLISRGQEAGMGGPVVEMEFGRTVQPPGQDNGWIAGVVFGVLIAVALIVVGVVFLVRRHNANKSNSSRHNDSYLVLDDIDDSTISRDMETTRSTFDGRSSDIK